MATPKLRFKEFDGDWNSVCLLEISSLVTKGTTPRQFINGDINFLKIEAITENGFDLSKCQTINSEIHHKELKRSILKEGDILFAIAGATIGKNAIIQKELLPANTNQALAIVRLKEGYSNIFISKVLNSPLMEKYIDSNISTGAQPNLNLKQISDFSFNLPKLTEQTKIAAFLSAVDEKISQLTQKHELLSQYKQGMMQKLFSQQIRFKADDGSEFGEWEEKKLGDICLHFQSGKTITSASISENGEYPVYGGNGLRGYTNTYTHDGIYALIGRQGALCGNINLVTGKNFISEHAIAVQTKKDSSTEWLSRWLDFMQLNRFSESSAQAGLAVNKLVKFDIFVPCLEEQTKIANFLSAIDQKIEVVAQQIEQAKQWKKGLLQQMFV